MPVLVTAADSALGSALVDRLVATGGEVRAWCSGAGDPGALRRRGAITAVGDLDDVGRLEAACEQVHTVVHLAGGLFSPSAERVVADVDAVVAAAAGAGVRRLVLASVLGADHRAGDPLRRAKALAEQQVAGSGVPSVAVRLPLVDTPGLRAVLAGTPLPDALAEHEVASCSLAAAAALLAAIDDLRSRSDVGHATLVAPGRRHPLGDWLGPPPAGEARRPAATYRPAHEVPLLASGLGGPWVDDDPVPTDAWAFAGVDRDAEAGA